MATPTENAKRLYEEGVETTKAWHGRLNEDTKVKLKGKPKDDHTRGAVSPLGGDGWWQNVR